MANTSPRTPVGGVLTPRMERLIRLGSIGSAVIIAISAMVLSYSGLLDLALDAQIHPRLALLVPIMVDGLQFVGSLGVVYSTLSGLRSWYPWLLMLMGVSVSAWGNWQAAPDEMTAKLLHAAAPIILALVLEELLRVMRHKVQRHTETERAIEAAALAAEQAVVSPEEPTSVAEPVAESIAVPVPEKAVVAVTESIPVPVAESVTVPVAESIPVPVTVPIPVPVTVPVTVQPAPQQAPVRERVPVQVLDEDGLPPFPEDAPFKEQVRAILLTDPEIPPVRIAKAMNKDGSYTRKTVRTVRAELEEQTPIPQGAPPVSSPAVSEHPTAPTQASNGRPDFAGADPFAAASPVGATR